jgi:hypothetical protein
MQPSRRVRRVVVVMDRCPPVDEVAALAPFAGIWIRQDQSNAGLIEWAKTLPPCVLLTNWRERDMDAIQLLEEIEIHHAGHDSDAGFEWADQADELDLWIFCSRERERVMMQLNQRGASIQSVTPHLIHAQLTYLD